MHSGRISKIFWMYTPDPNRAVDAQHYMTDHEVDVDVLYVADSAYAANRAPRSRHMAEFHRLEGPLYTKQTVYDILQTLDQSHCIWSHRHWYTMTFP